MSRTFLKSCPAVIALADELTGQACGQVGVAVGPNGRRQLVEAVTDD